MNKNLGLVLFILLAIVSITGCKQEEGLKIAFLYPAEEWVRFNKEAHFFKDYAEKNGVEVILETADNDESIQIQRANELFEKGIDALVLIAVNVNTAAAIVRNAHDADVPVMAYNRMIQNSEVDFFVASSNDLIGKLMVDALIKEKPNGNYVLLGGDLFDKNGEQLQRAVKKYLDPHIKNGSVNLVYETFIEKWSGEVAAFEMEKVISLYGDDIDAVIAGYDGMSGSVIEVLKKYNLAGKVAVTGQDAEINACKDILNGYQTMTVFHPLKTIAEKGAEIAIEMAKGKKLDDYKNSSDFNGTYDIPTHRVNSIMVTKDNMEEVLVKSGFYKKEQLFD